MASWLLFLLAACGGAPPRVAPPRAPIVVDAPPASGPPLAIETSLYAHPPRGLRYALHTADDHEVWRCREDESVRAASSFEAIESECRDPDVHLARGLYRLDVTYRDRNVGVPIAIEGDEERVVVRLRFLERLPRDVQWLSGVSVVSFREKPRDLLLLTDWTVMAFDRPRYAIFNGSPHTLVPWERGTFSGDLERRQPDGTFGPFPRTLGVCLNVASPGDLAPGESAGSSEGIGVIDAPELVPGTYRYRVRVAHVRVMGEQLNFPDRSKSPLPTIVDVYTLDDVFTIR